MAENTIRALLIEDSPTDALLLTQLVSEGRSRVKLLHAERLSQGLEVLRRGSIDVVLLDLGLPDASGLEAVVRTKEAVPGVAIVVLTGMDDEATALEAMQAGAQDYLVKGHVDGHLLVRAIRYARERKWAEEATLHYEQAARVNAEAAARRALFLAEASRILASSLDYDTTLFSVLELAVPTLTDVCLVSLIHEHGRVRRLGALVLPGGQRELWREEPVELSAEPKDLVEQVLRHGEVVTLTEVPETLYRGLRAPAHGRVLGPYSGLIVPLRARNRILGAMTFMTAQRPIHWQGHESQLALELAGQAALAMDNVRLYRTREQILEVISHDLRTPLTTMVGSLDRVRDAGVPAEGLLELISRSAQHMGRLIDDVLDMSRIEGGTLVLDRHPLEVSSLLSEVAQFIRQSSDRHAVRLTVSSGGPDAAVHADRRRILRVLSTLVGNGIKHTPPGHPVVLRVEAVDHEVRFEVADSGPGITERGLPNAFGRVEQDQVSELWRAGLSLATAKSIIEAHGGTIGIRSLEPGLAFFFTLARVSHATAGGRQAVG